MIDIALSAALRWGSHEELYRPYLLSVHVADAIQLDRRHHRHPGPDLTPTRLSSVIMWPGPSHKFSDVTVHKLIMSSSLLLKRRKFHISQCDLQSAIEPRECRAAPNVATRHKEAPG